MKISIQIIILLILKLKSPVAIIETLAGTGEKGAVNGSGKSASFGNPSIAVDSSGNVFIGDYGNKLIRKIDISGYVSTFAPINIGYQGSDQWTPGIALDNDNNVYLAHHYIRKLTRK